jgi:dienelactone hydrolase
MGAGPLEKLWAQIEATAGRLKSTAPRGLEQQDSFRTVVLLGTFERQQYLLRVVVTPSGRIGGFWLAPPTPDAPRNPPYADTAAIREHPVEVGAPGWKLPGTLTLPRGSGPFPVVVLVHGSGPSDRDQTFGPNRSFRDIALGLATRGIAVLRYDKRTLTHRARMVGEEAAQLTVEQEVIEDALSALDVARQHTSTDPARSFLLGHSLGGQLAPGIAQRDRRVAGVILLAAPAREASALMLEQFDYLTTLPQNAGDAAQAQLRAAQELLRRFRSGAMPDSAQVLGASARYLRDLDARDGVAVAARLDVPLLILQGERDYQVTMQDFRRWQDALRNRQNVTFRTFEGLNHHFMAASGTPNPLEYGVPNHVAVEVIDAVAAWIAR